MTKTVEFGAGMHIEEAATRLCEAATAHGEAIGKFNDIELHAAAGYAPAGIVAHYNEESERRRQEYRASPDGQKAAQEAEERRSSLQQRHDRLMKQLPNLNWSDRRVVLDWLCFMQEPSDHTGVIVKRQTIIEAFEKRGYKANANTGKDYKDGDRINMHEYLVGQALAGLKEGPAIHGIIHKFADEWRRRFPAEKERA